MINVDSLKSWVLENDIIEKAQEQCFLNLEYYSMDEPHWFKKDFGIEAEEMEQIKSEFYKIDFSMYNNNLKVKHTEYISVFLALKVNSKLVGYYKYVVDLDLKLIDDYLLSDDYF